MSLRNVGTGIPDCTEAGRLGVVGHFRGTPRVSRSCRWYIRRSTSYSTARLNAVRTPQVFSCIMNAARSAGEESVPVLHLTFGICGGLSGTRGSLCRNTSVLPVQSFHQCSIFMSLSTASAV